MGRSAGLEGVTAALGQHPPALCSAPRPPEMQHLGPLTGSGLSVIMAEDLGVRDMAVVVAFLTMKQQELLLEAFMGPSLPRRFFPQPPGSGRRAVRVSWAAVARARREGPAPDGAGGAGTRDGRWSICRSEGL